MKKIGEVHNLQPFYSFLSPLVRSPRCVVSAIGPFSVMSLKNRFPGCTLSEEQLRETLTQLASTEEKKETREINPISTRLSPQISLSPHEAWEKSRPYSLRHGLGQDHYLKIQKTYRECGYPGEGKEDLFAQSPYQMCDSDIRRLIVHLNDLSIDLDHQGFAGDATLMEFFGLSLCSTILGGLEEVEVKPYLDVVGNHRLEGRELGHFLGIPDKGMRIRTIADLWEGLGWQQGTIPNQAFYRVLTVTERSRNDDWVSDLIEEGHRLGLRQVAIGTPSNDARCREGVIRAIIRFLSENNTSDAKGLIHSSRGTLTTFDHIDYRTIPRTTARVEVSCYIASKFSPPDQKPREQGWFIIWGF